MYTFQVKKVKKNFFVPTFKSPCADHLKDNKCEEPALKFTCT